MDARLDAFVDDDPDELIAMAEHRPEVQLVVFDHPWNQTLDVRHHLHRVGDWPELTDYLTQLLARAAVATTPD